MTPLGKPLVFYLKYFAEMQRLYEADCEGALELKGLDDAEHVREMARTVEAAASKQAADFLELCGNKIEEHFSGLGITTIANRKKRSTIVSHWFWKARVWVPSVRDGWFLCGVSVNGPPEVRISLEKDVCGIVVPWLWIKGGNEGETAIWNILGGRAHSRGVEGLGQERGLVALGCILIKAEPPNSFDVDRDPLVTEVTKAFASIGAEQTRAIASFVAGLKESDED